MPTGRPYRVTTPGLRRALARVQRQVDERSRLARRAVGAAAVERLRSGDSLVNVDTGLMRRSFRFRVPRGRRTVEIYNTARSEGGYPYAKIVESRYRGAERTVSANRRLIAREARRAVERGSRAGRSKMRGEL